MFNLEGYCALDDSFYDPRYEISMTPFQEIYEQELDGEKGIEFFVSGLVTYPEQKNVLVMARPRMTLFGTDDLKKFIEKNVGDKKLLACKHYRANYSGLFGEDVEFVNKKSHTDLRKVDFFNHAHNLAHATSKNIGDYLKSAPKGDVRNLIDKLISEREVILPSGLHVLVRGMDYLE